MFLLAVRDRKDDGAYAVIDQNGDKVLFLFEEEDDATRYAMMLEDDGYPEMHVIEVDDDMMIGVCESHGYEYTVITPNDIVIPPVTSQHDFI